MQSQQVTQPLCAHRHNPRPPTSESRSLFSSSSHNSNISSLQFTHNSTRSKHTRHTPSTGARFTACSHHGSHLRDCSPQHTHAHPSSPVALGPTSSLLSLSLSLSLPLCWGQKGKPWTSQTLKLFCFDCWNRAQKTVCTLARCRPTMMRVCPQPAPTVLRRRQNQRARHNLTAVQHRNATAAVPSTHRCSIEIPMTTIHQMTHCFHSQFAKLTRKGNGMIASQLSTWLLSVGL